MQIHELTKPRKTNEGLLDTMRDGISAIKTGYNQGGDTLGQKLKGAAKASVSPQALAQAERERSNREKDKVIAKLDKQIATQQPAPIQPAAQTQPNVSAIAPPVTTKASTARVQPGTVLTIKINDMGYFKTPNGAWFERPDASGTKYTATRAMQIADPVKTNALEKAAAKKANVVYVKQARMGTEPIPGNFEADPVAQRKADNLAFKQSQVVNENQDTSAIDQAKEIRNKAFPLAAKKYLDNTSLSNEVKLMYLDNWKLLDVDTRAKINAMKDPSGDHYETGDLQLSAIQQLANKSNIVKDESLLEFLQQDLQSFKSKK